MSELLKDLETFRRGGWTSHWIEEKLLLSATHADGRINIPVPALSDFVMHALAEFLAKDKGYVKVVRCGECKLRKHCGMLIDNTAVGWPTSIDYCSAGERVVAKDATGEEGK